MKKSQKNQMLEQNLQGFTIIEFSLATAFIASLLIAITLIASMVTQIYQKGLTLKAVNSTARGLVDEFTANINAAPSVDTTSLCNSFFRAGTTAASAAIAQCKADFANKFIYQERTGSYTDETLHNEGSREVQLGGVFCTGNYSYIWNTYYGLNRNTASGKGAMNLKYLDESGVEQRLSGTFRLAQVYDPTYRVCSAVVSADEGYSKDLMDVSGGGTLEVDITKLANGNANPIPAPAEGMLAASDVNLQLYELTIFPISQDSVTLRTFMTGTFVLGTERGNINIERSGNYCDIEQYTEENGQLLTIGSEFTYCGINKFNFSARTAGM